MSFAIPKGNPPALEDDNDGPAIKRGGMRIVGFFLLTIVTAVSFHNFLHIPPVFGMMFGLVYLKLFGYYLKTVEKTYAALNDAIPGAAPKRAADGKDKFDIFNKVAQAEWDTLFFFYGDEGLYWFYGHLNYLSLYVQLGTTTMLQRYRG